MKIDIDSFSINHNSSSSESDKYYTGMNDKDFIDSDNFPRSQENSDKVLAKALKDKKSKHIKDGVIGYSYHLKILPNKTLVDSRTLHSLKERKTSYIDDVCKSDNQFLEVSQDTFQKYINFLKTENTKWLDMAQKDIK